MKAQSNVLPVCVWREGVVSRISGKERDAETGLDWFATRYMSSAQGRFTSPDSYNIVIEMRKGGNANEQRSILHDYISNPQVWNKYAYVIALETLIPTVVEQ